MFRFALLVLFALSCRPKEGKSCKTPNDKACADSLNELVCEDGTWKSFPCRGVAGCTKQGDGIWCDVSVGQEADQCPHEDEKRQTCSDDHKARLTCTGGAYLATKCVGIGCTVEDNGKVKCDTGQPDLGSPCDPAKDRATCGMDRKSHIHCTSEHRWAVERICRGPSGCQKLAVNESQVCDLTLAEVGDACRVEEASRIVCSVDKKAKLGCKAGKWAVEETCAKPCAYDDGTITCDPLTGCVMIPTGATCGG